MWAVFKPETIGLIYVKSEYILLNILDTSDLP